MVVGAHISAPNSDKRPAPASSSEVQRRAGVKGRLIQGVFLSIVGWVPLLVCHLSVASDLSKSSISVQIRQLIIRGRGDNMLIACKNKTCSHFNPV